MYGTNYGDEMNLDDRATTLIGRNMPSLKTLDISNPCDNEDNNAVGDQGAVFLARGIPGLTGLTIGTDRLMQHRTSLGGRVRL